MPERSACAVVCVCAVRCLTLSYGGTSGCEPGRDDIEQVWLRHCHGQAHVLQAAEHGHRASVRVRCGRSRHGAVTKCCVWLPVLCSYDTASDTMTRNLVDLEDASEGLDAFIGKRAPAWKHT